MCESRADIFVLRKIFKLLIWQETHQKKECPLISNVNLIPSGGDFCCAVLEIEAQQIAMWFEYVLFSCNLL